MPAFRRVEDARASATAVGILVPPGLRTFVILRPRALKWDLLPTLADETLDFCHFERDQAASVARKVQRALQGFAEANERLHTGILNVDNGFHVWLRVCGFNWVVCPRNPGARYQPFLFAERERAQESLRAILPFFQPAQDAEQEYYFNTQNFARD